MNAGYFCRVQSVTSSQVVTNDYRTEFEVLQIYNIFIFHLLEKLKIHVLESTESPVL